MVGKIDCAELQEGRIYDETEGSLVESFCPFDVVEG